MNKFTREQIEQKILKYKLYDEETLKYFINYFYAIQELNVVPNEITIDSLIENGTNFVDKIYFYDENDEIFNYLGPDCKGLRDSESKILYCKKDLDSVLKEITVYHEIHHAVQTNPENNMVGINQTENIGRLLMEAQTQYIAEKIYCFINEKTIEERNIKSEKLRMCAGGTIKTKVHNYELYDVLMKQTDILLGVSSDFFVSINYLFNDDKGLKILEDKYNEVKVKYNLKKEFISFLFYLDYIYVVDLTAYLKGTDKDKILSGNETELYQIYPKIAQTLSLKKQMDSIIKFENDNILALIETNGAFEEYCKYIINDYNRKIFEGYTQKFPEEPITR